MVSTYTKQYGLMVCKQNDDPSTSSEHETARQ
jgi:hypothetical protein